MKPWVVFTGAKQKKTDWNRQGLPENCPIRNACLWFLLQIVLLVCTNEFDPGHGGTEALLSWRTRVLLTTCSDAKSIYPGRIRKSLWVSEREGVREQGTCCIQSINDIHTHTCAISHIMYCKVFWNHTRGGQRFISILSHIHMQFFFIDTMPVKKWYHLSGTASSVFDHLRYLELQVDNFSEKLGVWYVVCMHVMSRQQSPVLLHISADGQHIPKGPERFPSVLCVLY